MYTLLRTILGNHDLPGGKNIGETRLLRLPGALDEGGGVKKNILPMLWSIQYGCSSFKNVE